MAFEFQQYPNLATFPDYMWNACKLDGKIYGVPCPGGRSGQVAAYRVDWYNKLGGTPTDAQTFRDTLIGCAKNDPDGNGNADTWGVARYESNWDMSIFYPMHRVPNNWHLNDDGTLTSRVETDEFRMALEFMAGLFRDGAFHPDSAAMQFEEALQVFTSGRVSVHADGGDIYGKNGFLATIQKVQPEVELARLIPFGYDGGQGVTYNLPGIFGFTAMPATLSEDRVHQMLALLNWFSSPFGSEEWLFKSNGIEGVHFEYNENGFPVTNDKWNEENGGLTAYLGGSLGVNYNAEEPEIGPFKTDEAKAVYALGIDDPAAYLFSPAAIEKGPTLSQLTADAIANIVTGRDSIDSLADTITSWQNQGGYDIRAEYEAALANS